MSDHKQPKHLNDTAEDFYQDFADAHIACEHALIELEQRPDDLDLVDRLRRNVNAIKSRMIYAGLRELSVLMQGIEDVLTALHQRRLNYDTFLNDVLLLAMDKTQVMVDAKLSGRPIGFDTDTLNHLSALLSTLGDVPAQDREELLREATRTFDPTALDDIVLPASAPARVTPNQAAGEKAALPPVEDDLLLLLNHFDIRLDEDLQLFIGIAGPVEARSMYWNNSTARILRLALAMNQHAGQPVDPSQLAVAVILHDVGMAFLPVDILHKQVRLESHEIALLQTHPLQSASLLSAMTRWHPAAEAIRQHHERMDGRGYPAHLPGERIAPAAKIIAIADTFEARTHERAYTTRIKRPFIRAILEINSCAGTQFDPYWVGIFNDVARRLDHRG